MRTASLRRRTVLHFGRTRPASISTLSHSTWTPGGTDRMCYFPCGWTRDSRHRMVYVRLASVTGRGSCVDNPTSVDLFAGAGGLALGIHRAGFEHRGLVEFNRRACNTLRRNADCGVIAPPGPVFERDVRDFDYHQELSITSVDLLAGGAPCQPFSLGGKHRGNGD